MSGLPIEIAEQILFRLPARSLIRLSLVCKQWRSSIFDPKFVRYHAHRVCLDQSNRYPEVIVHRVVSRDDLLSNTILIKSIDYYESLDFIIFEVKFPSPIFRSRPIILGCCNGLWLLNRYKSRRNKYDSLVLWNPLVSQKYRSLRRSNLASSYECHFGGFGYTTPHDYKVVRLCRKISDGDRTLCYSELKVEVYSLKTNSWKIIAGVPPSNIAYSLCPAATGTLVNGSIYWYIYDSENAAIIAFDLITEKFKFLEANSLDDDDERMRCGTRLLQVRGYLGVYRSAYNSEGILIWIWNEDENRLDTGLNYLRSLVI